MSRARTLALTPVRPVVRAGRRRLRRYRKRLAVSGSAVADHPAPQPVTRRRATALFWEGVALHRMHATERAIDRIGHSLSLDPRYGRRWSKLVRLARIAGRNDLALQAMRRSLDAGVRDPTTIAVAAAATATGDVDLVVRRDPMASALAATADTELQEPRYRFLRAAHFEWIGFVEEARPLYRSALAEVPGHPDWLRRYARFECDHGTVGDAIETYTELRRRLDRPRDDGPPPSDATAPPVPGPAPGVGPDDPVVLDRQAAAQEAAGDLDAAAAARLASLEIQENGRRLLDAARTLHELGRDGEAAELLDRAIEWDGDLPTYNRSRVELRTLAQWGSTAVVCRRALERRPDDARLWFHLGVALERVDDAPGAIEAYDRSLALEPDRLDVLRRLLQLSQGHGSTGVTTVARYGLTVGESGDLERSAALCRQVLALLPDDVQLHRRLGLIEEQAGNLDAAEAAFREALRLDPTNASCWHLLGRVIAGVANERGLYHEEEHDELERVWGRAIELAPRASGSRQQLVRASIKAARWPLASRLAWYPGSSAVATGPARALVGYLETTSGPPGPGVLAALDRPSWELADVPLEWWFPLHWRLLTDNEFTAAYRAKELMALAFAAEPAPGINANEARALERARALTFLGRGDEALADLATAVEEAKTSQLKAIVRKHIADIEFSAGRIDRHLDTVAEREGINPPEADARFRELIEDRTVAIVGPAQSEVPHGEEIDGFDTVIRTKHLSSSLQGHGEVAGSRTHLSYYALGSARHLREGIAEALADGSLEMAVFRTATYAPSPAYLHRPGDVRYVPNEHLAGFRSSPFAIQRIIYDILPMRPRRIKVFNIDFFVTIDSYRPGYLAEYADRMVEQGYVKVLGSFGHDFLTDFRLTRVLADRGIVEGDERVTELLALEPAEYLKVLDRRS